MSRDKITFVNVANSAQLERESCSRTRNDLSILNVLRVSAAVERTRRYFPAGDQSFAQMSTLAR